MARKIRITIDLEIELLDWIEQYMKAKGISRNQVISEAVKKLKEKEGEEK